MDFPIRSITESVALQIGEYPDLDAGIWTAGNGCRLREMVEVNLENIAREVTLSLPLSECREVQDMRNHIRTNTDWGTEGMFSCPLPENFLRLHQLLMPDWPHPLSEDNPGDALRLDLGGRTPEWLACRPGRPTAIVAPHGDTDEPELCFGPTAFSQPRIAAYVPKPVYNNEEGILTNLQPDAFQKLVEKLAAGINLS